MPERARARYRITFQTETLVGFTGDILEDVDLILTLEDAKKTSDEVKEKFAVAIETEAKINETSENYRPSLNVA